MDKTRSEQPTWREHADCLWTWPSSHGVTGCEDHGIVFETPSPREAWDIDRAVSLLRS